MVEVEVLLEGDRVAAHVGGGLLERKREVLYLLG